MANVNPDSAIGVQIQLEEALTNQHTVCFQAALLYTSSRGILNFCTKPSFVHNDYNKEFQETVAYASTRCAFLS
jgi:hypothetical protein